MTTLKLMIMFLMFNDDDKPSIMTDNEIFKSLEPDDNHYHPSRIKSASENLQYKPRCSKYQSFKNS